MDAFTATRVRTKTAHEDRYIRLTSRWERAATVRSLQNTLRRSTGTRESGQTIRNCLHEDQQSSRRREVRIELTEAHRNWTVQDWAAMLFTDESKIKLYSDDRRIRVWRRGGERVSRPCIHEIDRFEGPSECLRWDKLRTKNWAHTFYRKYCNCSKLHFSCGPAPHHPIRTASWTRVHLDAMPTLARVRECVAKRGGHTKY